MNYHLSLITLANIKKFCLHVKEQANRHFKNKDCVYLLVRERERECLWWG